MQTDKYSVCCCPAQDCFCCNVVAYCLVVFVTVDVVVAAVIASVLDIVIVVTSVDVVAANPWC